MRDSCARDARGAAKRCEEPLGERSHSRELRGASGSAFIGAHVTIYGRARHYILARHVTLLARHEINAIDAINAMSRRDKRDI